MTNACLSFVLVGFLSQCAWCQVANNSIRNRLRLEVDAIPTKSTTAAASVEWNCINKSLTSKCLVYHNDQWFDFLVSQPGRYFLNISAQQCNQDQGVQAIILEGNPCETSTYRILRCINRIRLEDAFIQMDSLKAGVQYLVNIDGFLGDFCDFRIQLATRASGFPFQEGNPDSIKAPLTLRTHQYVIDWLADPQRIDLWQSFRVYRWKAKQPRPTLVSEQSVVRNAYGVPVLSYRATDSLVSDGLYTYRVYGVEREWDISTTLLVQEVDFIAPVPVPKLLPPEKVLRLALPYKEKLLLEVMVYDPGTDQKKLSQHYVFDPARSQFLDIDLGILLEKGMHEFLILVVDGQSKEAIEFHYSYQLEKFVRQ